MSTGFVMLMHKSLERGAQVAAHWADSGCPVVVHVDARVEPRDHATLVAALAGRENVRFAPRFRCEWGTWSIVKATQTASGMMLNAFPDVRHVFLASGSCLPLRPVPELSAYLDRHPDTDFIESVTTREVPWTMGGLESERFVFRFPFSWRRQRRLFDVWVEFQRRFGLRRKIPAGIVPHLGSQWWCLTRNTLEAILNDRRRPELDRFFRRVWIPDESYFQTQVRRHSTRIESRSLTLAKFDFQGRPHQFYDDHLQLLRRSDCFVARKIWPQADALYRSFLSNDPAVTRNAEPNPGRIDRLFTKATVRRLRGRAGLRMQSRLPLFGSENARTCAPYSVFQGFADVINGFEAWVEGVLGGRVHGHLYARDRVHFAGGETIYNGSLSDSADLRDHDPEGFLVNLIWNTRGERQCFQFSPRDRQEVAGFIAYDSNAQISVITGAWAVPLFTSAAPFEMVRPEAARLQAAEARTVELLRDPHVRARVRIWSLAEFLESPLETLQTVIGEIAPREAHRLTEVPRLRDLTGLDRFLQRLRNAGMNPYLVGDLTAALIPPPAAPAHRPRPHAAS
jgi:hypothetical protein